MNWRLGLVGLGWAWGCTEVRIVEIAESGETGDFCGSELCPLSGELFIGTLEDWGDQEGPVAAVIERSGLTEADLKLETHTALVAWRDGGSAGHAITPVGAFREDGLTVVQWSVGLHGFDTPGRDWSVALVPGRGHDFVQEQLLDVEER